MLFLWFFRLIGQKTCFVNPSKRIKDIEKEHAMLHPKFHHKTKERWQHTLFGSDTQIISFSLVCFLRQHDDP